MSPDRTNPTRTEPGGLPAPPSPGHAGLPKGTQTPQPGPPRHPPVPPRGRRSRRARHLPAPGRRKGQRRWMLLTLRRAGCGRHPSAGTVRSTTAPSSSPWHPAGRSSRRLPAGSARPGRAEGRPRTPGNKGPAQPRGCAGPGGARPDRRHRPRHRHHRPHRPAPRRRLNPAPKAASPVGRPAGVIARQPVLWQEENRAGWKSVASKSPSGGDESRSRSLLL